MVQILNAALSEERCLRCDVELQMPRGKAISSGLLLQHESRYSLAESTLFQFQYVKPSLYALFKGYNWASAGVVVEALCYKPEGRGFLTR
jgi:hypothetical protein